MSRTYATPLEIEIHNSQSLTLLVLVIAIVAMISALLTPFVLCLKLSACSLIVLASYVAVIKHNQQWQLIWYEANQWTIKSMTADLKAQLLPDSYVSPRLTVLCFRTDSNKKLSIMIFADAINPEQFRRLRARLKIESAKLFAKKTILFNRSTRRI